jgi:hypothetical protein
MISSLTGNPLPTHIADKWQPRKQHSERNQLDASAIRGANRGREQKSQSCANCGDQLDR